MYAIRSYYDMLGPVEEHGDVAGQPQTASGLDLGNHRLDEISYNFV